MRALALVLMVLLAGCASCQMELTRVTARVDYDAALEPTNRTRARDAFLAQGWTGADNPDGLRLGRGNLTLEARSYKAESGAPGTYLALSVDLGRPERVGRPVEKLEPEKRAYIRGEFERVRQTFEAAVGWSTDATPTLKAEHQIC